MYYVYILTDNIISLDHLYVGYTSNIDKRIERHKSGLGSKYVRFYNCVNLVYLESVESMEVAIRLESKIKSYNKQRKINLIMEYRNEHNS